MRRLVAAGMCAVAALGAGVPGVALAEGGAVTVAPRSVRAGDQVIIRVGIADCGDGVAFAKSRAFAEPVELGPAGLTTLTGLASVRRTAEPRRYDVTVECLEEDLKGSLLVLRAPKPRARTVVRHVPRRDGTDGTDGLDGTGGLDDFGGTGDTHVGPATGGGWLAARERTAGRPGPAALGLAGIVVLGGAAFAVRSVRSARRRNAGE
ncbi:hypothetical protein [Actinomadura kijaniata]|uniref:hypothetical protein n=1 Tax=Actinomadura kijaniata TaxID=46161 RepID=UPI0012F75B08|nr:hypothetical protein [Actinomadura kijaniata]